MIYAAWRQTGRHEETDTEHVVGTISLPERGLVAVRSVQRAEDGALTDSCVFSFDVSTHNDLYLSYRYTHFDLTQSTG